MLIFALIASSVVAAAKAPAAAPTPSVPKREVGALVFDGVDDIPDRIKQRMTQYSLARAASLKDFAPDGGGILITTRFGETAQVHQVKAAGGDRRQLTFLAEPVNGAFFDPARPKDGFFYVQDVGGGEFYQYYWFDNASGKSTLLTDGKSRHESPRIAHAGGRIAFANNARNGKDLDVYVMTPGEKPKLVMEAKGSYSPIDWSPDDKQLLVRHYVSINESYLHVLDLESGESRLLNEGVKASYGEAEFAHGKSSLFYTSDEDSEYQRLWELDLKTGKKTLLTPDLKWDIDHLAVGSNGRFVAYTLNEGGKSTLYRLQARSPTRSEKLELPVGVVYGLSFDRKGEKLGVTMSTSETFADVWLVDMGSKKAERWTYSETGGLDPKRFVTPELISFKSFDEREIPAWLYKPKSAEPAPVVISIHGGPESQSKADFSPTIQYWVNELGAAVLVPNVRGSSGYGKSYLMLDNGEKREDSVKDIGALLDWIGTQPALDGKRVAVYGGSYGGFMVLASLAMFNDRLTCGVDVVGISSFVSFLERTEPYRRDLRRAEYGDERDPKMRALLQSISPLTKADKIKAPLFVVQGKNDPRVPVGEAEQIVGTVRKLGKPVWYLLAKDEGHGFQKRLNREAFMQATALFFEKHLLGSKPAEAAAK